MIKRGRKAIYSFKDMTKTFITTPGIYHHEGLGLISLRREGRNRITLSDKNLGATEVWNAGDELSENNCGKYYQWGNNYGFPWTGDVTTSEIQVDASNYGPGNYYNSDNFIITGPWDTSNNGNLWGGESSNIEDKQGPCPSGYHVENGEFDELLRIHQSFGMGNNYLIFINYLKIPLAGKRFGNELTNKGVVGYYRGSGARTMPRSSCMTVSNSLWVPSNVKDRINGFSIRPFKNTPVQPDLSRSVLYQPN